jgi:hypothetical protein
VEKAARLSEMLCCETLELPVRGSLHIKVGLVGVFDIAHVEVYDCLEK